MGSITIAIELDPGTEGAVASTAAEGGIGYWAVVDSYRPSRWFSSADDQPQPVPDDFVFYTIVGVHEGDLDDLRDECVKRDVELDLAITPALIRRGMQLFIDGTDGFAGRLFDDMGDLSAMDAAEADCVVQLGVFGTLIYG